MFSTESSRPSIEASTSTSATFAANLVRRTMAPREFGACVESAIFMRGPRKTEWPCSLESSKSLRLKKRKVARRNHAWRGLFRCQLTAIH